MEKGSRESIFPLKTLSEASRIITEKSSCIKKTKIISIIQLKSGYILAKDYKSKVNVPNYKASTMDGYAFKSDWGPGIYKIINEIKSQFGVYKINTGNLVPKEFDCVVKIEDTKLISRDCLNNECEVEISSNAFPIFKNTNLRLEGSDIQKGQIVFHKGYKFNNLSVEIGLFLSMEIEEVEVFEKPIIGIFSSGDEIVDNEMDIGKVIDINRPILKSLFCKNGFEVKDYGIVKDIFLDIKNSIYKALNDCDVIVTTGGVSMGEKDFVKAVLLSDKNIKIHFGRVFLKPGKPLIFSTFLEKLIFSLPGNPVSSIVTSLIMVLPSLYRLSGDLNYFNPSIKVELGESIKLDKRPEFHRAKLVQLENENGVTKFSAFSTGIQLSSKLLSFFNCNALLELPSSTPEVNYLEKGAIVKAYLIDNII